MNNGEIWCFHIFHRLAPKCRKVQTMLRWVASKFFIASRQNIEKSKQCWDQLLPNLSSGRSWDIGKIIVLQGKRIDFRTTGILEKFNFCSKKSFFFRKKSNCNGFAQKVRKMWSFNKIWRMYSKNQKNKKERGKKEGRRARTAKREKGAKKQGRSLYTP